MPPPASDLFETIAYNLSDGIYAVREGKAIFLNRKFGEIFGIDSVDELIGKDMFSEVYPDPETADLFREIHQRLLLSEQPKVSWGQFSTRRDGTAIWVEAEARILPEADPPVLLGTFHDRTDCKLIGEAMHFTQETLRLLLDAMEDRVYVVTDDYRIVYANRKMLASICADINDEPCYRVCRGLPERCADCSQDTVFKDGGPVYKEFFNERTQTWSSVIELAVRMPGVDRPAKLAVARDITRRREAEQKVRALTHRLLTIQEEERKHLSRELHDDLGQQLNALKIGLNMLAEDLGPAHSKRFLFIEQVLDGSIDFVRRLSSGLRPATLERLGLVRTLRDHCALVSATHGIPVSFETAGMNRLKVAGEVEINLYRILQEALHNVVKHASARRVGVRLVASHPTVRLVIEDDGRGFVPADVPAFDPVEPHLGIVGMTERVELVGGKIDIDSAPGAGTRIVVEVPTGGTR